MLAANHLVQTARRCDFVLDLATGTLPKCMKNGGGVVRVLFEEYIRQQQVCLIKIEQLEDRAEPPSVPPVNWHGSQFQKYLVLECQL